MTHYDIYKKFMIEYDKANVTSSYPSLTEYEVATILDKAYLALIARKLTGNNTRRVPFEYDIKAIEDLRPLVTSSTTSSTTAITLADNELAFKLPTDMLYYLEGQASYNDTQNPADEKSHSNEIITLVDHKTALKFRSTNTNMPWIKLPVSFLQDDDVYVLYDTYKHRNPFNMLVTYIKKPASFVASLGSSGSSSGSGNSESGSGGNSGTGGDSGGTDTPTPTQLQVSGDIIVSKLPTYSDHLYYLYSIVYSGESNISGEWEATTWTKLPSDTTWTKEPNSQTTEGVSCAIQFGGDYFKKTLDVKAELYFNGNLVATKTVQTGEESSSDWKIKEVYKSGWDTFLITNSYDLFSVTWENKNTGDTCKSITVIPELSNVEITDNSIKILDNLTSNKKVTIHSTCIEDPTMVYTETVDVFPKSLFYRTVTIKVISADGFPEATSAAGGRFGFMDGDHFIDCDVYVYKQIKKGNSWETLATGSIFTGNVSVVSPAYLEYARYVIAPGPMRKDGHISSGEYNIIGWSDNVSDMDRVFPGNTTDNSSEFNIVMKKIV